jgi:hypothetical protein
MRTITYGTGRVIGETFTAFIDDGTNRKEFLPYTAAYDVVIELICLQILREQTRADGGEVVVGDNPYYEILPHDMFYASLNNLFLYDTRLDEY